MHQLPRLETIDLTFFPADVSRFYVRRFDSDSYEGRLALQRSILVSLASSFSSHAPLKLISLSLQNLRTWDIAPIESPPFQSVLKNLRRLRLSVLYDRAHDVATPLDRWLYFWDTLCYRLILAPTQHALTELTLHTDGFVGAAMGMSFTGLYFPNLRMLSLSMFVFEPSVGAEPFILKHADTLAQLELVMCKLHIPNDEEPSASRTRWERIWESFATGLTALVVLHVGGSEHRYVRRGLISYGEELVPPGPVSYWEVSAPVHLEVSDAEALERLYFTVTARSEEARGAS
jgi:hypothetical protein